MSDLKADKTIAKTFAKTSAKTFARKPTRYDVNLSAVFKTVGSLDWQVAHLLNLSLGGLCVETSADLTPQQVLEMVIETVDNNQAKHRRRLVAKVIWRRENQYGLEFMQTNKGKKNA